MHERVIKDKGSDDLDRVLESAMTTGHLHVLLVDGCAQSIFVLLIHVNGIRAGEVAEDSAIVPDASGFSLEDLAG